MSCLTGKKAPDFISSAVLPDGSVVKDFKFYDNIEGKNALLFFYPMDFTFVCPSELIALNNRLDEFKKRNTEIITVSVDSHFVHKAWRNTSVEMGGIGKSIGFTMVSDIKKKIISDYSVIDENTGVAYRGSFLIDRLKVIRIQQINDFALGRNIDELLRLFDALNFHEKYGNVCQAGWSVGDPGIIPTTEGIAKFLTSKSTTL